MGHELAASSVASASALGGAPTASLSDHDRGRRYSFSGTTPVAGRRQLSVQQDRPSIGGSPLSCSSSHISRPLLDKNVGAHGVSKQVFPLRLLERQWRDLVA